MSKRKTHKEYVDEVSQKFPNVEVVDEYINAKTKIKHKCKVCGSIKLIAPNTLLRVGISCPKCSDGISYPEKFMISMLSQLNVTYIFHYRANWSQKKIYDFYLPNYNCIIEMHGEQHYKGWNQYADDLKHQQDNDMLKEKLAIKNGIKNYVIIDCRKATLDFIKNSIINSNIISILNFTENNIDWNKCSLESIKSNVQRASDLWNSDVEMTTGRIAEQIGVDVHTVGTWLKRAAKCNMCDYTPNKGLLRSQRSKEGCKHRSEARKGKKMSEEQKRKMSEHIKGVNNPNAKSIICIETNIVYNTITEASQQLNISRPNISKVNNNPNRTAGGYHWKNYYFE